MNANQIDRFISNNNMNVINRSILLFSEGAARVVLNKAGEVATGMLYKWWLETSALSKNDLERYRDLVEVYSNSFGDQYDIPSFWKLSSDNRPTFAFNYSAEINKTQSCIDKLIAKKSGMYLARAGILSLLVRYIQSMQNRWVGSIRGDGIELMFVLEMLTWFKEVVPELDQQDKGHILHDLNKSTLKKSEGEESKQPPDALSSISSIGGIQEILKTRIDYCKKLSPKIAKYNFLDSNRANFLDLIQRLTEQLESYRMYLIQKSSIIRFNVLINTLSDQLSELSALSFHVLHLLINGANQSYLIVEQFLSPYPSDVKVIAQKNKRIGVWLEKTLQLAGIQDSTFESNKKITFASIQHHLENEIPSDENFNLEGSLRDPLSKDWGHWDFILNHLSDDASDESKTSKRQELEIQAVNYLQQIRQLSRSISLIYFIRQNMVRAATVASVFGEVWIYGDRVGKVVLEELLLSIIDVIGDYSEIFQSFWEKYFNDLNDYARKHGTNHKKDKCFNLLTNHVDLKYKPAIEKVLTHIKNQIDSIRAHSHTLPQIKKETKKIKKDLYKDILDFMKFKNKSNSSNYIIIKNALDDLEFEQTKEEFSNQELSTVVTFPPKESRLPQVETEPQRKPSFFATRPSLRIFRSSDEKARSMENNDRTSVVNTLPLWGNHLHLPGRMHLVDGDGNCFFRAVAFELNRQNDEKLTHQIIREEGVKYLINYKSLFDNFTCENQTPEQYLDKMSLPGTWAEGLIIDAVALCFHVHLCILDVREDAENKQMFFPIHINEKDKNLKCTVGLVRQALHYNALELPNSSIYVNKTHKKNLAITEYQDKKDDITSMTNFNKGISETCIKVKRSNFSMFESISILLGAPIIVNRELLLLTTSPLLKRPKQFHTEMHKYIYDNFLLKHDRIIKYYLLVLSAHYRISKPKANLLVSLYKKVNACFVMMYDKETLYNDISKLEKTMIEERLYRNITKAFADNNFFQFTLPAPNSALEVTKNGDSYDVVIDSYKIPEIKNAVLAAVDEHISMREKDKNKISELEKELAKSKQEAVTSKQEASASKQELFGLRQELSSVNEILQKQWLEIETKDDQIKELKRQLDVYKTSQLNNIEEKDTGATRVSQHSFTTFGRSKLPGDNSSNCLESESNNRI